MSHNARGGYQAKLQGDGVPPEKFCNLFYYILLQKVTKTRDKGGTKLPWVRLLIAG